MTKFIITLALCLSCIVFGIISGFAINHWLDKEYPEEDKKLNNNILKFIITATITEIVATTLFINNY